MKRPLPNLLVQGFRLALRNWPCVVWAYAVNLIFALLAGVPFASGLASYLDHSLAAQRIAGTLDISYLSQLAIHLHDTGFFPMVLRTAAWLNLFHLVVLFFLFAGTVFIYVSAEPPLLSVLLRGGIAYFWRFVRATLLGGGITAIVIAILLAARAALMARANAVYVERKLFLCAVVSLAVVLLGAVLLRLWWDLVEVYVVRNVMDGERRVRRALLPAFRLLSRYFFRTVGSFFLVGLAGVSALGLCLFLWRELPAHQVWIASLLAQVGLFLLLACRFWQRGLETTLVMSADPPHLAKEDIASEEIGSLAEEDLPSAANIDVFAGLSEPTLRDLVLKLRTEPLANPENPPGPLSRSSTAPDDSPVPTGAAEPPPVNGPSISLLDRHETKFPLGSLRPDKEAGPANSVERPKFLDDLEKSPPPESPHSEKKPLP
jgi:hypothetical protein